MKSEIKHTYLAYLLRLWRDDESTPWRASLENPHTGERKIFSSLKKLVEYLQEQTGLEDLKDEEEADFLSDFQ